MGTIRTPPGPLKISEASGPSTTPWHCGRHGLMSKATGTGLHRAGQRRRRGRSALVRDVGRGLASNSPRTVGSTRRRAPAPPLRLITGVLGINGFMGLYSQRLDVWQICHPVAAGLRNGVGWADGGDWD